MEKRVIHPQPPAADMPFVPAITIKGDHTVVYASGCTASPLYHSHPHVEEELRVPDDIRAQTRMTFENIQLVLGAGGATLKDVVRATVYLTDREEMDAMNEEYEKVFRPNLPARTCVIVSGLVAPNLKIEVEVTAVIPG